MTRNRLGATMWSMDEPKVQVRLSAELRKELRLECVRREKTVQDALREAIQDWLRKAAK